MVHLAGSLRYLMPMDGGTVFFLLAIYRHFSTFKKPWLPIKGGGGGAGGGCHLKSPKTDSNFFLGAGSVEGVIKFMPTGCSFKCSLK
jgi:hypothetical protein